MIKIGDKVYLNLQEAVLNNSLDIELLKRTLGYLGPFASLDDIEDPVAKALYLVGTTLPYSIYQYTGSGYTYLGTFAAVGAQGAQGIPGERGPAGIPGVSAGFGTPEAHVTTLASDVDASVSIETSGPDTAKVFAFNFGIPQGTQGATGNGIASIAKTGTVGLVDTYTITMTDGSTYTFTVTNGEDGSATIEAGYGININGDEISIDQTVVALKSDIITSYNDLTDKPNLNVYAKKDDARQNITAASMTIKDPYMGAISTTYNSAYISMSGLGHDYTYGLPTKSGTFAMTDDIITSYNDLTDKPSIPTKTSDLTNDSGFITSAALTNFVTTTQLNDALDDYALKTDLPENVSELTNDAGYTTQTWVQNQGYITGITSSDVTTALGYTPGTSNFSGDYDDLTDKPDLSVYELKSEAFSGNYNDLTNKPDLSIYAESADLATVATTGSYNDLTNKPTIPTVDYPVTDVQVDGVSVVSNKVASITMPTVPTKTSDLTNDSGFITGVTWNDVTGKPTFATVATSGSYNDLSNKPTIPSNVTSPFIGVNQTSLGNVMFSADGTNYFANVFVNDNNPLKVNLKALNPNFGTGLTSSYNSSTNALDVAVDTTTVALKNELFSGDYNDLTNKPTLFSGNYNDLTNKPDLSIYETKAEAFSGSYNDLTNKPNIPTKTSDLTNDSGFITSSDLTNYVTTNTAQTITGTKTFAHTPEGITDAGIKIDMYNAIKEKVGVEFNTYGTGSLQNWCLSAFNGDLRIKQMSGTGTFTISNSGIIPNNINSANLGNSNNRWNNLYLAGNLSDGTNSVTVANIATKSEIPTVPTNVSAFTNDAGYITGITSSMVTTALGYTPGTSNFDGAYNSLTGKPDLSIYAQSADLATVATSGSYTDLTDKPNIPTTATSTSTSTSTSTVTPTTVTLTFTYSDNTTENVTLMTSATVATSTTTTTTTTLS